MIACISLLAFCNLSGSRFKSYRGMIYIILPFWLLVSDDNSLSLSRFEYFDLLLANLMRPSRARLQSGVVQFVEKSSWFYFNQCSE